MKYRVAMWASAGFVVAGFWALYLFPTALPIMQNNPMVWMLARVTCPVMLLGSYFHFGFHFYWVLLANAAVYGLAGVVVEMMRRERFVPSRASKRW